MRSMPCFLALIAVLFAFSCAQPRGANAAFPGRNGPIIASTVEGGGTVEIDAATWIHTPLALGFGSDAPSGSEIRKYSPDGTRIAVLSGGNSMSTISVASRLNVNHGTVIADGHLSDVAWSPDQHSIAYVKDGDVMVVAATGGTARRIYGGGHSLQLDWSTNGSIVYTEQVDTVRNLVTVTPSGSNRHVLALGVGALDPHTSPDGHTIAFTADQGNASSLGMYVAPIAGGTPSRVLDAGFGLTIVGWMPDATEVVYRYQGQVRAIHPDGSGDRLLGSDDGLYQVTDIRPIPTKSPVTPGKYCGAKSFGPVITHGCFVRHGSVWSASGSITANGLTIAPKKGLLEFDEKAATLTSTGRVTVKLEADKDTLLYEGPIRWNLTRPISISLARSLDVKGLSASGTALLRFTSAAGGGVIATLNLALPDLGVEGSSDVTITQSGLDLTDAVVSASGLRIPPRAASGVTIRTLRLAYSTDGGVATWKGDASLEFPIEKFGTIGGGATVTGGRLTGLRASYEAGAPGRPLGTSGVFLQSLDVAISIDTAGFVGHTTMTAGPEIKVLDTEIAAMSGTLGFTWSSSDRCPRGPSTKGNMFRFDGNVKLVEIVSLDGSLCAMVSGFVEIEGDAAFDQGPIKLQGATSGWASAKAFSLKQDAKISFKLDPIGPGSIDVSRSATTLLTSKGMGACAGHYTYFPGKRVALGFRYDWKHKSLRITCNSRSIKVHPPSSASMRGRSGGIAGSTVQVPARVPEVSFTIDGVPDAALPRLTITAPDGSSVTTPSAPFADDEVGMLGSGMGDMYFVSAPGSHSMQAIVGAPGSGTWTFTPTKDAAAIRNIAAEISTPEPEVSGSVRRSGSGFKIGWRASNLNGASIDFYEEGSDVGRPLFSIAAPHGAQTFVPIRTLSNTRRIIAIVSRDGVPISRSAIGPAIHVASAPRLPAPRGLHAARLHSGAISLKWHAVRGATAYVVTAQTGRKRVVVLTAAKANSIIRNAVATRAVISVAALDRFGRRGPATSLRAPR